MPPVTAVEYLLQLPSLPPHLQPRFELTAVHFPALLDLWLAVEVDAVEAGAPRHTEVIVRRPALSVKYGKDLRRHGINTQ